MILALDASSDVIVEVLQEVPPGYDRFLLGFSNLVVSHRPQYWTLIENCLDEVERLTFVLKLEGVISGSITFFFKRGRFGLVANSMPFYGSHGGFLLVDGLEPRWGRLLARAVRDYLIARKTFLVSVTSDPFQPPSNLALQVHELGVTVERMCQVTHLPEAANPEEAEKLLFDAYKKENRTSVRRARSLGLTVDRVSGEEAFTALRNLHVQNMIRVGGEPKQEEVFSLFEEIFANGRDFELFQASQEGDVRAMLLLIYSGDLVEYWMPGFDFQFKDQQALSLTIHEAMVDSVVRKRARVWNWGGTLASQTGLFQFKKSWGAVAVPYSHQIEVGRPLERNELFQRICREDYRGFFLLPFS
jgi:hypothetical protein